MLNGIYYLSFVIHVICSHTFRGNEFRTAFKDIYTLLIHLQCQTIALSGTITVDLKKKLPLLLGLNNHIFISENPDRSNIFFQILRKPSNVDIVSCSESIYIKELNQLNTELEDYPVTLCFMSLQWCSDAQSYAISLFGLPDLFKSLYAVIFSNQDENVTNHVFSELKKTKPFLRLIFCSSSLGMGFDFPCITRVIHAKPPRNIIDFVQQVGRAGRLGQPSQSLLYFNASEITNNVDGMTQDIKIFCNTDDCLRTTLLSPFGFDKTVGIKGCKCCSNCKLNCICNECFDK